MSNWAIEARSLTKIFREGIVAVNELDLEVKRGSVYGLMGRNGAGKTTSLRLLLGLLQPDRGSARVLGWDFRQAPRGVRQRVAYVSQTQQLPGGLSLEELSLCLKRLNGQWDETHARGLAERWSLPWKQPVASLSSGEQRKAAIVLAFASRPEVLVLDEPAAGFDLVARRQLVDQIVDTITQRDGCTVLLSTHIIGDLERVADNVGIIEGGRLALSSRLEDLLNSTKRVQVIFEDEGPPSDFAIPGVLQMRRAGAVVNAIVRWTHGGELDLLRGSVVNARVQVFPIGLEEIFLELFGNGKRNTRDMAEQTQDIRSN